MAVNDLYATVPNLVLGFHGCEKKLAEDVASGRKELHPSKNSYDWLGEGIYFWERDYERALDWAKENPEIKEAGVIGAVLDLGYCLDLDEYRSLQILRREYDLIVSEVEDAGLKMPENKGADEDRKLRYLDHTVIEHLMSRLEESSKLKEVQDCDQGETEPRENDSSYEPVRPYDSVRGLFQEGGPLFPGAGIREKNHIQIAIRNVNCIKVSAKESAS